MKKSYAQFANEELTLRDQLAIERTLLANERTLLAYVRTMIGLMAVGGTLIKFFSNWFMILSGWGFLVVGVTLMMVGFSRYIRMYITLHERENADVFNDLHQDRIQYFLLVVLKKLHLAKI